MKVNATITVTREIDEEERDVEVHGTGKFYHGGLDSWSHESDPPVSLTQDECDQLTTKLMSEFADDWDEDGWQANREREA